MDEPQPTASSSASTFAVQELSDTHPPLLSNQFVNHPKRTCAISCIIPFLAIAVIIISRSFSLDDPTAEDYFIRNDVRTRLDNAREALRRDYRYVVNASHPENFDPTLRESDGAYGFWILIRGRHPDSGNLGTMDDFASVTNVLTPQSFSLLKRAEDLIINHPRFPQFCHRDPEARDCDGGPRLCALPDSFLNHPSLFGIRSNLTSDVCARRPGTQLSLDDFNNFVDHLFNSNQSGSLSTFFSVNASNNPPQSWISQSYVPIGIPLPGFDSPDDRVSEQDEIYDEWALDLIDLVNDLSTDDVDVYSISFQISNSIFGDVAFRDLSFSIVAMIIVFIIIWIHTSSAYLSIVAMLNIFLSFPIGYLLYKFVFRQFYFGSLQILTIFLLLGIGADDVFVFTDAWKQAGVVLGTDVDLVKRMQWTYRRSVRAMTVTSFTTAAAFFVTATSPIMPISTLGIWAGLLILIQFALVITVYPCAVVIWHRFWRRRLFVNRCFGQVPDDMVEREAATPFWHRFLPVDKRPEVKSASSGDYRAVERFFRGPWFRILHRGRYVVIGLSLAVVAVAIWLATGLQAPETEESFLPSDHPIQIAFATIEDGFPVSDEGLQLRVRVSWGIKDVDRTGTSKFSPDNVGNAVLDETFDFTKASSQLQVLKACSHFLGKDLLFDGDTGIDPISCWINDYKKWRSDVQNSSDFEDFSSGEQQVRELDEFASYTDPVTRTQPFLKYAENQHFIFDKNNSRVIMTEVRFVSDVERQVPYRIMWPVYNRWQDALSGLNDEGPASANKAIATGGFSWKWQMTQRTLVRSMFVGIAVMLVVALVTLMAATLNWAIAILSTLCIGGIIACLLAVIRLLGWELGISESVGVVISVGYSFDGAAHIATAYIESTSQTRVDKARDALTDLGISILFGGITTLCAGFLLFPAIIVFFVKFAALIVGTVTLNMIFSLGIFPALLMICGPEGNFGSLSALSQGIFRRRKGEESSADTQVGVGQ